MIELQRNSSRQGTPAPSGRLLCPITPHSNTLERAAEKLVRSSRQNARARSLLAFTSPPLPYRDVFRSLLGLQMGRKHLNIAHETNGRRTGTLPLNLCRWMWKQRRCGKLRPSDVEFNTSRSNEAISPIGASFGKPPKYTKSKPTGGTAHRIIRRPGGIHRSRPHIDAHAAAR